MEANVSSSLQLSTVFTSKCNLAKPSGSLKIHFRLNEKQRFQMLLQNSNNKNWCKPVQLKVLCESQNVPVQGYGSLPVALEEIETLKNLSEEIEPRLDGKCIFLVGMMGSGKTTVGRILSEALGYSFCDSDKLIEQAVGGTVVADIFRSYGEKFFRDNETEELRKLSSMQRLVVSTGGGAVVRPVNWKYMWKGITVWLDVPLEALARRITAVGTDSRPLLHFGSGDAYAKTFKRLSSLWEERSEAYTNANARVSLQNIAAKLGYSDVCNITPTEIAIEALLQIEAFLDEQR